MVELREDENLNKVAVEVASLSLWYLFRLLRVVFCLANVKNKFYKYPLFVFPGAVFPYARILPDFQTNFFPLGADNSGREISCYVPECSNSGC